MEDGSRGAATALESQPRRMAGVMALPAAMIAALALAAFPAVAEPEAGKDPAYEGAAAVIAEVLCRGSGRLRVMLVDEATFGRPDSPLAFLTADVTYADAGKIVPFRFDGLRPGRYAVRAYLDQNGDGRLNGGIRGPTEPWALSWAGEPRRGVPRFEDIAFEVTGGLKVIRMEVQVWMR